MTVPTPGDPHPDLPLAPPPESGEPRDPAVDEAVASAMAALDGLADRPLAEHVEAFERVHAALTDALASGSSPAGTP